MTRLADASKYPVFSNGTEGDAWMHCWCYANCVHEEGCDLILDSLLHNYDSERTIPEAWLPEPDDGNFFMPSRMVCLRYAPNAEGDPGAEERAERVAEVMAYWRAAIDNAPTGETEGASTSPQWPERTAPAT